MGVYPKKYIGFHRCGVSAGNLRPPLYIPSRSEILNRVKIFTVDSGFGVVPISLRLTYSKQFGGGYTQKGFPYARILYTCMVFCIFFFKWK